MAFSGERVGGCDVDSEQVFSVQSKDMWRRWLVGLSQVFVN